MGKNIPYTTQVLVIIKTDNRTRVLQITRCFKVDRIVKIIAWVIKSNIFYKFIECDTRACGDVCLHTLPHSIYLFILDRDRFNHIELLKIILKYER